MQHGRHTHKLHIAMVTGNLGEEVDEIIDQSGLNDNEIDSDGVSLPEPSEIATDSSRDDAYTDCDKNFEDFDDADRLDDVDFVLDPIDEVGDDDEMVSSLMPISRI